LFHQVNKGIWAIKDVDFEADRKENCVARYYVLVVDDDATILWAVTHALKSKGYHVKMAVSGEAAMALLSKTRFDLVITDLTMEGMSGTELLKRIKELYPDTAVMVLTANEEIEYAIDALRYGADEYLLKPCDLPELFQCLNRCFEKSEGKKERVRSASEVCPFCEGTRDMLMAASHDLRGSLVSLCASLKLLNRGVYGTLDANVGNKVTQLYNKVKSLIGMTEDFIGKAACLHGDFEINGEKLDLLDDVIDPVLSEFSQEMLQRKVSLGNSMKYFIKKPVFIKGSRIWLKTVFRNLLVNAIKYGGEGCRIGLFIREVGSLYKISVYNSGKPIPEEYREKIFGKFAKMATKTKTGYEGVGLGLYLIKKIINKHGGDIWYKAEEGGSNFVFTLPRN